jgi:hypothetical protein
MKVLRIAGGVFGVAWIVFGLYCFIPDGDHGLARRLFVGIGFIGTGIYFLNFAITGRQYLFYRGRR